MSDLSTRQARPAPTMPRQEWRKATCQVCGQTFDYLGTRRPKVCRAPECKYKFQFKIDRESWAAYQPTLFEATRDE